jgi:hypothetical protein
MRPAPTIPAIPPPVFADRPRPSGPHLGCNQDGPVTDPAEIARIRGQTPQQIADEIAGDHQTRLEWATLIPPFEGGAPDERATVSLTFTGEARLFPWCQNLVELDMRVGVRTESGTLAFEAPARFTSWRRGSGRITTEFPNGGAQIWEATGNGADWRKEIEAVSWFSVNGFRVDLLLLDGLLTGRFAVAGGLGGVCDLAIWPAAAGARVCQRGEHVVDGKIPFRGLLAEHVVGGLQGLEGAHPVRWEDTGAASRMRIAFSPDPGGTVCVVGDIEYHSARVNYEVPGRVSLVTDDGRLDVSLPVRAITEGIEGDWGAIKIRSTGLVNLDARLGTLPVPDVPGPNEQIVVDFSSPRRETLLGGPTLVTGGFNMWVQKLKSSRVKTAGGACSSGDFLGRLGPVTSASFQ